MISMLYRLFPPTIHPMVIHFTIAFIYLTALAGIVGLFVRKDSYFARTFLYMLVLSILATLAAGIAGSISQSYIARIPPGVGHMFETHKNFGELTGVLLVLSFAFQAWAWWRQRNNMRVSVWACVVCLAAVVTVSIAGHLGGDSVYKHGLGVLLGQ